MIVYFLAYFLLSIMVIGDNYHIIIEGGVYYEKES